MRCLMCERKYSDEHGDSAEGFCSIACRRVYEHIYGPGDLSAERVPPTKA